MFGQRTRRCWAAGLVATALAAAGLSTIAAENEEAADAEKLLPKTYDVRGLVPDGDTDLLTNLCTSVIAPETWEAAGGPATISFLGSKMTVRQTAAVQQNIAALLEALRKLPDPKGKPPGGPPPQPQIPVGTQKLGDTQMEIVIYPVADLLGEDGGQSLLDHLKATAARDSWDEVGGPATMGCFLSRPALVASNTKEAQKELLKVLAQLRAGGEQPRRKR